MRKKNIQLKNSLMKLVETYKDHGSPDLKTALRDMLTDVMHVCDEKGISFEETLEGAGEVFIAEKESE